MVDHSWNDSWFRSDLIANLAFHRMSLSRRRLSVCEYRTVESLNHTVNDRWGCITVHVLLFCVYVKHLVEREFQSVFQIFNFRSFNGDCFLIEKFVGMWGSKCPFSLIDRSESANNFYISRSCNFLRTWHQIWK